MEDLIPLLRTHGALVVFLVLFLKRMGAPVPVVPFLLLAGAQGAQDRVFVLVALASAMLASTLADAAWFHAGRRYGRGMLGLMCRVSLSPGTCIRRSELAFAQRGAWTVVAAKFVPGVGGLAPPLAGALGMRSGSFILLNFCGTLLWTGSVIALGFVFRHQVDQVVRWLAAAGHAAWPLVAVAFAGYLAWLLVRRILANRATGKAPRIPRESLLDMMKRGDPLVLVDVRGAGSLPETRIPGALHAAPGSDAFQALSAIAPEVQLVTYCDCPEDVSAARAALQLMKRGLPASVLSGGLPGWVAAGLPVEAAGSAGNRHALPITMPAARADLVGERAAESVSRSLRGSA